MAKEGVLRVKYMTTSDCIFCKIVTGDIPSKKIFEDGLVVAFPDINPVAKVHVLIIPKKHIGSALEIKKDNGEDLVAMFDAANKIVSDMKLEAFRLSFNGGKFQHVPHLHMHLLAGSKIEWSKL